MPTRAENEAKTMAWAITLRPLVEEIMAAGAMRPTDIARELNRRGVPTMRDSTWTHVEVSRLARRLGVTFASARTP